jgi:hypothetical protein
VTTKAENAFVQNLDPYLNGHSFSWLGGFQPAGFHEGTKEAKANGWEWVNGEVWSETQWHSAEPNNLGNEDCLMNWAGTTWNDAGCSAHLTSMVEYSGATFQVGECDTGIVDLDYDLCSCNVSPAGEALAKCTDTDCIQNVGSLHGFSQFTTDAILETCLVSKLESETTAALTQLSISLTFTGEY